MPRGWPPLELRQIEAILTALGLRYARSTGGHQFWKGVRRGEPCTVTVDPKCAPFSEILLRSMCKQARSTRTEFYGATVNTAKKIR